jgi:hypothetical protein
MMPRTCPGGPRRPLAPPCRRLGHRCPAYPRWAARPRAMRRADCGSWKPADRFTRAAAGEPVLLLWHDLGAAGEVRQGWRPLLARRRPGAGWRRTGPGHGGSRPLPGLHLRVPGHRGRRHHPRCPRRRAGAFAGRRGRPRPGRRRVHHVRAGSDRPPDQDRADRAGAGPRGGRSTPAAGLARLAGRGRRPLPAHPGPGRTTGRQPSRGRRAAGAPRATAAGPGSGRVCRGGRPARRDCQPGDRPR